MKGKPKFKYEDRVSFTLNDGIERTGKIYIVDVWGTWENDSNVSYDILVEEENCLYKHITEKLVKAVN